MCCWWHQHHDWQSTKHSHASWTGLKPKQLSTQDYFQTRRYTRIKLSKHNVNNVLAYNHEHVTAGLTFIKRREIVAYPRSLSAQEAIDGSSDCVEISWSFCAKKFRREKHEI